MIRKVRNVGTLGGDWPVVSTSIHWLGQKTRVLHLGVLLAFWMLALSCSAKAAELKRFRLSQLPREEKNGLITFRIPKGTYLVSQSIKLPSNTALVGQGSSSILRFQSPFPGSRLITNSDLRRGNENIVISSFSFEFEGDIRSRGTKKGIFRFENVKNITLSHLAGTVKSRYYILDLASDVRKGKIKECVFSNLGIGGAVMVRNGMTPAAPACHNIIIEGNFLKSSTQDEPLAVFGWLGLTKQIFIDSNDISATGASFGICVYGIDNPKHSGKLLGVTIQNNRVRGSTVGGIGIKGGAEKVRVVNNTITDTLGDGIFIHPGGDSLPGVKDILVYGNLISRAGRHGILACGHNILIKRNTIRNARSSGCLLSGRIDLIENTIRRCHPGVLVLGGGIKKIKRNLFWDAPIRVLTPDPIVFESNLIK